MARKIIAGKKEKKTKTFEFNEQEFVSGSSKQMS